ncbi:hypothetical protein Purlil1_13184 [Purpureocillium lilacinum]|uniref:Transcription factor domain-containing protein n=1 Tax=Purpureocillium lilacinum TaxID=33203 RepID=A0ABR0BER8_PURLI|nr:hypothetical protein Purlil1_13184 [Purpureocillium lilacinum]
MNTRAVQSTPNLSREAPFQTSGDMTYSQQAAVPVIGHRSAPPYLNNVWDSSRGLRDPTRHHRVTPGRQTYQADRYAGAQPHAGHAPARVQQPATDLTHGAPVPRQYTVIGQQASVENVNTDHGNPSDQLAPANGDAPVSCEGQSLPVLSHGEVERLFTDAKLLWDWNFDTFTVPTTSLKAPNIAGIEPTACTEDEPRCRLKLSLSTRDALLYMVYRRFVPTDNSPSFPSSHILSQFLCCYFIKAEGQSDNFIHLPSLDTNQIPVYLLAATIAKVCVSLLERYVFPDELVHFVTAQWPQTPDLSALTLEDMQAVVICLDICLWCGYSAASHLVKALVATATEFLRKYMHGSELHDGNDLSPASSDDDETIISKWQQFIERESRKRLLAHIYISITRWSIWRCAKPTFEFSDLGCSPAASADLWSALNAEEWRDANVSHATPSSPRPRMGDRPVEHLDERGWGLLLDVGLCETAYVHGLWAFVYSNSVRDGRGDQARVGVFERLNSVPLEVAASLRSVVQNQGFIDEDNSEISGHHGTLILLAARKLEEVPWPPRRNAAMEFIRSWAMTPASRESVWQAGRSGVGRRSFGIHTDSVALKAYCAKSMLYTATIGAATGDPSIIWLDGADEARTQMFREHNQGVPSVRISPRSDSRESIPLCELEQVLRTGAHILRNNLVPDGDDMPALPSVARGLEKKLLELASLSKRKRGGEEAL